MSLFWHFSAVTGRYLIGDIRPYNFRFNFFPTVAIYILAIIPLLFLMPMTKEIKNNYLALHKKGVKK